MRMNPGIAMQGQPVNVLGAMDAGMQMGHRQNEMQRQNALAQAMQEHGPGLVQGDQGAASELAQYDPQMVAGVQNTQNQMQDRQARLGMAREQASQQMMQRAQQMSQAELQAERENIERGLAMGTKASNAEEWDAAMRSVGADDMIGQFENREMLIAGAMGIKDALDRGQPTTAMQTLAQRAQAAGLEPGSPEYSQFMREGTGTNITVNTGDQGPQVGTIPQGWALREDPEAESGYRMVPIEGGPAQAEAEQAEQQARGRQESQQRAGQTVLRAITRGLDIIPDVVQGSGTFGATTRRARSRVPGTPEYNLQLQVDDFLSNVGLDRLQEMRENSPTGGALGQVPVQQQARLERVLGSFDLAQDPEILQENLSEINNVYLDIMFGSRAEREALVDRGEMSAEENREINAQYRDTPYDRFGRRTDENGGETRRRNAGEWDETSSQRQPRRQEEPQGQDLTADQIRAMSREDFLALDPMSLPDGLLDDYESRLREFGNE